MTNHRLDTSAYLARIGYSGPTTPTLDVLARLQRHHIEAIPFETLTMLVGEHVSLELPALQRKVIFERRGGYCFELNLLFLALLRDLGFDARPLTGRVTMGGPEDALTARTHTLLLVTIDGVRYTADVGFGGMTPTGPLRLDTEDEQATPHEPYRLTSKDGNYTLHARIGAAWRHYYMFDLTPPADVDFEVGNWYVSTHPDSPFRGQLIAARAEPGTRHALRGGEYTIHRLGAPSERRHLDEPDAVIALLKSAFHIDVPSTTKLRAAVTAALSATPA